MTGQSLLSSNIPILLANVDFGDSNEAFSISLLASDFPGTAFRWMINTVRGSMVEFNSVDAAFVASIYNVLVPAGLAFAVALTLYHILTTIIKLGIDKVTLSSILMPIIKGIVAFAVIMNGSFLIGTIMGLSNKMNAAENFFTIYALSSPGDPLVKLTGEAMELDGNILTMAQLIKRGFYLELLTEFCGFLALVAATIAQIYLLKEFVITKAMILIRFSFAPLAIADMTGSEHRGGVEYVKQIIACGFMLFSMTASIYIIRVINAGLSTSGADVKNPLSFLINYLVVSIVGPFAAVAAARRAKSVVEDTMR